MYSPKGNDRFCACDRQGTRGCKWATNVPGLFFLPVNLALWGYDFARKSGGCTGVLQYNLRGRRMYLWVCHGGASPLRKARAGGLRPAGSVLDVGSHFCFKSTSVCLYVCWSVWCFRWTNHPAIPKGTGGQSVCAIRATCVFHLLMCIADMTVVTAARSGRVGPRIVAAYSGYAGCRGHSCCVVHVHFYDKSLCCMCIEGYGSYAKAAVRSGRLAFRCHLLVCLAC